MRGRASGDLGDARPSGWPFSSGALSGELAPAANSSAKWRQMPAAKSVAAGRSAGSPAPAMAVASSERSTLRSASSCVRVLTLTSAMPAASTRGGGCAHKADALLGYALSMQRDLHSASLCHITGECHHSTLITGERANEMAPDNHHT